MSDGPPICDMRWHLLDPLYNWGSSERALPLPLSITIIPPYAYCSSHHLLAVGIYETAKKSSVSKIWSVKILLTLADTFSKVFTVSQIEYIKN